MAKTPTAVDILVIGDHPAAHLAAALLAYKSKLSVAQCAVPGQVHRDRLVTIHPDLFSLHPLLEPLKRKIRAKSVYGAQLLSDDSTRSEYRCKSAMTAVGSFNDVRSAMEQVAGAAGATSIKAKQLRILRVDDSGVQVALGNTVVHPTALVLGDALPEEQQRILGMPEEWERGVIRRYSYIRLRPGKYLDLSSRPVIPMSLNLKGNLSWAWLLPGEKGIQLCIDQSPESTIANPPDLLLRHWADVLTQHGVFRTPVEINPKSVESVDIPAGGALAHEGVANRTLLVGPAGGFYSATMEDIYPNCWSTVFAADVLKKSLKQPHLQDALQAYRHIWRTTLGDYMRGPQQNLRFLLPLIYRNPVMTQRMVEGILVGRPAGK